MQFRVPVWDLVGERKTGRIATARGAAMLLMRRAGYSFPEIAREFNRHHTTAIYACTRIGERRMIDAELYAALKGAEARLGWDAWGGGMRQLANLMLAVLAPLVVQREIELGAAQIEVKQTRIGLIRRRGAA